MRPEQIVAEIKESGLRAVWRRFFDRDQVEVCCNASGGPKHVICNGDEGDPGAFMDRSILESDPHSVIQGMIIAAHAVGARYGHIYVRAEYPLAERVQMALQDAEELNLLGRSILGSHFSFDIKLFQGSGAFVCGEETALIASLEGNPGVPRHRPPYPTIKGLHGKPTLINNVKTLAYVRHIVEHGSTWFAGIGTERCTGTAVFALAGKVVSAGLVEVPTDQPFARLSLMLAAACPSESASRRCRSEGRPGLPSGILT